ncbi:MAG: GntR family transcriptional regulator [Bacillota bacterium]
MVSLPGGLVTGERIIPKPLYTLIKDRLLEQLEQGVYKEGERLPSEDELARRFGTSRVTLREALRVLEESGYVLRRQGVGTFVRKRRPTPAWTGLERLTTLAEVIETQGHKYGVYEVLVSIEEASPQEARKLEIEVGEPITAVSWTSTADGDKVARSLYVFPDRFGDRRVVISHLDSTLFEYLENAGGAKVMYARATVLTSRAGDRIAKRLSIKPNTQVLCIDQVVYDQNERAMVYGRDYCLPDKFTWTVLRKRHE